MKDIEILSIAKTYVRQTLIGMGALKGAPCQIKSIVENPAGVWTITFEWEDTTGATHTDDLVLHDGAAASNYPSLSNLPTINGVTITGNMSGADLGLANLAALAAVATSGDYYDLDNLPTLGTAAAKNFIATVTEDSANLITSGGVYTAITALQAIIDSALANKVDKVTGKDLSTNDYTDTAKAIVDGVKSALANKVDKIAGKGLSANDFTDTLKNKLDDIASGAQVNVLEAVKLNGTTLNIDANKAVNVEAITSISVQGTAQTIIDGAVDLDVLTSDQMGYVSDAQYTAIQTLFE